MQKVRLGLLLVLGVGGAGGCSRGGAAGFTGLHRSVPSRQDARLRDLGGSLSGFRRVSSGGFSSPASLRRGSGVGSALQATLASAVLPQAWIWPVLDGVCFLQAILVVGSFLSSYGVVFEGDSWWFLWFQAVGAS